MGSFLQEAGTGFGTLMGGFGVGIAKYLWVIVLVIAFMYLVHRYYKDRALREQNEKSIFQIFAENLELTIMVNKVRGIKYVRTKGNDLITPILLGEQCGIIFNGDPAFNREDDKDHTKLQEENNICYIGFKKPDHFIFKIPIIKIVTGIFKPKPVIIQCFSKDIIWDFPNKSVILKCNNIIWRKYWFELVRGRKLTNVEVLAIKEQVESDVFKQGWEDALNIGVTNTKKGAHMNAQVNLETRINTETQTKE